MTILESSRSARKRPIVAHSTGSIGSQSDSLLLRKVSRDTLLDTLTWNSHHQQILRALIAWIHRGWRSILTRKLASFSDQSTESPGKNAAQTRKCMADGFPQFELLAVGMPLLTDEMLRLGNQASIKCSSNSLVRLKHHPPVKILKNDGCTADKTGGKLHGTMSSAHMCVVNKL